MDVGFSISPSVWVGFLVAAVGFGLLFLLAKAMGGGRMMRVPDGEPPDKFYRDWKSGAFGKKISRAMVFIGLAAVAMLIGGLLGIVAGLAS